VTRHFGRHYRAIAGPRRDSLGRGDLCSDENAELRRRRLGTGLILLLLLAAIFAVLISKGRKRLGLGMTGRTWIAAVIGFGLVVLVIYVAQQK
jgi:hypothetical protein